MKKKFLLTAVTLFLAVVCFAAEKNLFQGLTKANHISGPEVTLQSMKGKVVLFDYWGLGCPPCHASMPKLEALWKKYGSKYLVIIGSESWRKNRKSVKAFLQKNKITFPIYQGVVYNNIRPRGVPHAILIDSNGKFVERNHPGRLYQKVAKMCEELKNGK